MVYHFQNSHGAWWNHTVYPQAKHTSLNLQETEPSNPSCKKEALSKNKTGLRIDTPSTQNGSKIDHHPEQTQTGEPHMRFMVNRYETIVIPSIWFRGKTILQRIVK